MDVDGTEGVGVIVRLLVMAKVGVIVGLILLLCTLGVVVMFTVGLTVVLALTVNVWLILVVAVITGAVETHCGWLA